MDIELIMDNPQIQVLGEVRQLMNDGRLSDALALLERCKTASPWLRNAYGVCLMRQGKIYAALTFFNQLTLTPGSLRVADEVPVEFKTNLATARLLAKNVLGCVRVLKKVTDKKNPAVQRLRRAVREWDKGLSLWQRFLWRLRALPKEPIPIDFTPGDV